MEEQNKLLVIAKDDEAFAKLSKYIGGGPNGIIYAVKKVENNEDYYYFYFKEQPDSIKVDLYDIEIEKMKGVLFTCDEITLLQVFKNHIFIHCLQNNIDIFMPMLLDNKGNEIDLLQFSI